MAALFFIVKPPLEKLEPADRFVVSQASKPAPEISLPQASEEKPVVAPEAAPQLTRDLQGSVLRAELRKAIREPSYRAYVQRVLQEPSPTKVYAAHMLIARCSAAASFFHLENLGRNIVVPQAWQAEKDEIKARCSASNAVDDSQRRSISLLSGRYESEWPFTLRTTLLKATGNLEGLVPDIQDTTLAQLWANQLVRKDPALLTGQDPVLLAIDVDLRAVLFTRSVCAMQYCDSVPAVLSICATSPSCKGDTYIAMLDEILRQRGIEHEKLLAAQRAMDKRAVELMPWLRSRG